MQVRVLPGSIKFLNLPEVALTYCSFETCPGHFKCFPSQLQPSGDSMLAYELASSRNCFLAFIGGSRLNKLLEWLACIHSNNIKFMRVGLLCLGHLRGCFQSNRTITQADPLQSRNAGKSSCLKCNPYVCCNTHVENECRMRPTQFAEECLHMKTLKTTQPFETTTRHGRPRRQRRKPPQARARKHASQQTRPQTPTSPLQGAPKNGAMTEGLAQI